MKPIKLALLLGLSVFFLLTSCKKDSTPAKTGSSYTCTTCSAAPEAVAEDDASSKGIYKGVVIGSTGTIKFDVFNGSNTIIATMVIDGATVILTSDITWSDGEALVAPFTGVLNGSPVTINFQVNQDGSGATVTSSDIPGHPLAQFAIAKETSTSLIESYEGTYSTTKPEKGTFNLLLSRQVLRFGGIARKDGDSEIDSFDGSITSDGKLMESGDQYIGTLSGDNIDGQFKDNNGVSITIKGKRTL